MVTPVIQWDAPIRKHMRSEKCIYHFCRRRRGVFWSQKWNASGETKFVCKAVTKVKINALRTKLPEIGNSSEWSIDKMLSTTEVVLIDKIVDVAYGNRSGSLGSNPCLCESRNGET
jgi:hypothetical protein